MPNSHRQTTPDPTKLRRRFASGGENIGHNNLPPPPGLRQSSCTSLLLTIYRSTGQTDGRTPYRYIDAHGLERPASKDRERREAQLSQTDGAALLTIYLIN